MNSSYMYDPDFNETKLLRFVLDNAAQLQNEALGKFSNAIAVIRAYDSVLQLIAKGADYETGELRTAIASWYAADVLTRRVHIGQGLRPDELKFTMFMNDAQRIDKLERYCLRLIEERNSAIRNTLEFSAEMIEAYYKGALDNGKTDASTE